MGDKGITVLVVEDEVRLRMDIAQSLEDDGFQVLEASNAAEAIDLLNSLPGRMDGLRLAAAARDRWPPIHIIVTSGHRAMSDDTLPVVGRFFSKLMVHYGASWRYAS